jgi:1-deoxyxylulose-5-phosphate synthase
MMPLCIEEKVAVIPWSPLARGLLAGSRKALDDRQATARAGADPLAQMLYKYPSDMEIVEAVKRVAEERGVQPAQVALAWLLAKPGVTAPIVGATKMEHLDAAIGAVDMTLSEEEMKLLEAPYVPHEVSGMFG